MYINKKFSEFVRVNIVLFHFQLYQHNKIINQNE